MTKHILMKILFTECGYVLYSVAQCTLSIILYYVSARKFLSAQKEVLFFQAVAEKNFNIRTCLLHYDL
jgi:hypothetical protein